MKKKLIVMAFSLLFAVVSITSAATIDIYVQASGDVVTDRYWGYFGQGGSTNISANPNTISHSYYPGDGYWTKTSWTFDLSGRPELSDILSVTFNYVVLDVWSDGRDVVAELNTGNQFLVSNGLGWKSFDVTDDALTWSGPMVTLLGSYTGYSGIRLGAAEGGLPAYLRFTTADAEQPESGQNPVPEPTTMLLFGIGLLGLAGINRRKK